MLRILKRAGDSNVTRLAGLAYPDVAHGSKDWLANSIHTCFAQNKTVSAFENKPPEATHENHNTPRTELSRAVSGCFSVAMHCRCASFLAYCLPHLSGRKSMRTRAPDISLVF